jgi:hypothetical protein
VNVAISRSRGHDTSLSSFRFMAQGQGCSSRTSTMIRSPLALASLLSAAALCVAVGVIAAFAVAVPPTGADRPRPEIPLFEFEQQAALHCPDDSIIWATAGIGEYSTSSDLWYGRTSTGAYGCLHEAEKAGYRAQRADR